MTGYFDDQPVVFPCPKCEKEITITKSQVGQSIHCAHCNQLIHLDDDGFLDAIDEADKALDDFVESLNDLF